MNRKNRRSTARHWVVMVLGMLMLTACATRPKVPESIFYGVWEITEVQNVRRVNAGSTINMKLIFQPEHKLYKLGPAEDLLTEDRLYHYRVEDGMLVRGEKDGSETKTHFKMRWGRLKIYEPDGARVYLKRRSVNYKRIPILEEVVVPFTINFNK